MIAAGAIYVIGGRDATTYFRDVYVSTDGGADRTRAGVLEGYYGFTRYSGVLKGFQQAYSRYTQGYSRGTQTVLKGYQGALKGHSRGRGSKWHARCTNEYEGY